MATQNIDYEGYVLSAQAQQNERGAWYARVSVLKDNVTVAVPDDDTTQPEWLTAEEALRDGIDRARALVERRNRDAGR